MNQQNTSDRKQRQILTKYSLSSHKLAIKWETWTIMETKRKTDHMWLVSSRQKKMLASTFSANHRYIQRWHLYHTWHITFTLYSFFCVFSRQEVEETVMALLQATRLPKCDCSLSLWGPFPDGLMTTKTDILSQTMIVRDPVLCNDK